MKRQAILLSACAMLALGATAARADCAAELAAMQTSAGGAISKDGSVAPLSGTAAAAGGASAPADATASSGAMGTASGSTAAAGTATGQGTTTNFDANTQTAAGGAPAPANSGEIIQDGTTAPLAAQAGQGSTGVANSEQDAMAQQSTAAAGTSAETTASVDGAFEAGPQRMAALEKARAAQASGNEAACMAALQEARGAAN